MRFAVDIQTHADIGDVAMTEDHFSWEDVYRAYGCSVEMEPEDDGG